LTDIFISYSRADQPVARRFAEGLQRAGFSVWWDQALNPGEAFDQVTEKALAEAKAVVVLWSKTSVNSRWVRAEATQANADNRLVPVMIEPCKRPIIFELTHTADLANWKGGSDDPAWQSFLAGLRRFTGTDVADNDAPIAAAATKPMATDGARHHGRTAFIVLAGIALLVIVMLVKGWPGATATQQPAEPAAASSVGAQARILVKPFTSNSVDADQVVFADGLTRTLHNQLTHIRGLALLGIETTISLRNQPGELAELGARYSFDYLLGGSVDREGGRLRVIPTLLDVRSGLSLKLNPFVGDVGKIVGMEAQQAIARDVAAAVGVAVGVGDLPPDQGGTRDVDAWKNFQRAASMGSPGGVRTVTEAIGLARKAIDIDPGFLAARLFLYRMLSPAMGEAPQNYVALMREQEDEARRLATAPESWQLTSGFRADFLYAQRQWAQSLDATTHMQGSQRDMSEAFVLMATGRIRDALPALRSVLATNPAHPVAVQLLVLSLAMLGQFNEVEEVVAQYRKAAGTDVAQDVLQPEVVRQLFVGRSSDPRVLRRLKELLSLEGGRLAPRWLNGRLATLDDADAMSAVLRRELDNSANYSEASLSQVAAFANFYGQSELVLRALNLAKVQRHYRWPASLWMYPEIRKEQGFKDLVRAMGLHDYWRQSGKWSDFCTEDKRDRDGFTCH
jgi:TolB-like protein/tetratricopeptide (TPR) repeat protein